MSTQSQTTRTRSYFHLEEMSDKTVSAKVLELQGHADPIQVAESQVTLTVSMGSVASATKDPT